MTVPFTLANLVIWLFDKVFHRVSLTNNAVLSEFSWKGLDLKVEINVRSRILKSVMQ